MSAFATQIFRGCWLFWGITFYVYHTVDTQKKLEDEASEKTHAAL